MNEGTARDVIASEIGEWDDSVALDAAADAVLSALSEAGHVVVPSALIDGAVSLLRAEALATMDEDLTLDERRRGFMRDATNALTAALRETP